MRTTPRYARRRSLACLGQPPHRQRRRLLRRARRRLVAAAKAGESAAALSMLQRKADPNAAEVDGTTALHWAVRNGDATLVDRLLRAGAKATAANRYGVTPLPLACELGDPAIVERLLEAGVSANLTGPLGETALHTCARAGHVAAAKVLVAHGASLNAIESWRGQTPIMWAAAQGHGEMVSMLAEAGADVNARSGIIAWERQRTSEPRDKWLPPGGFTPLLFAAREGRVDAAKALIAAGADVSVIDPDRQSALVIALINGHFDVANLLIDKGADVNTPDKVGRTALWAAVDYHTPPQSNRPAPNPFDEETTSLDVIKNLLAHGARVDASLTAQTPYRTKLDRGADGVLGAGTTPLLRAAKAGDTPVVKLLLEKGANPKAVTRNGVNGIMMAANVAAREEDRTGRSKTQKDAIETITLLLAAGTDIQRHRQPGPHRGARRRAVGPHRRRPVPAQERREARRRGQAAASRRSKPRSACPAASASIRSRASCARTRPRRFASSWA